MSGCLLPEGNIEQETMCRSTSINGETWWGIPQWQFHGKCDDSSVDLGYPMFRHVQTDRTEMGHEAK